MSDGSQKIGQLLRNFIALGAGNYGAMIVSLLINALLTRRLGAEAFGRLALLLMISQVVLLLAANWTQTGAVRFGAQEFAATGSVATTFWTRLWLVAPWLATAAVVLVIGREPLAAYFSIPASGIWLVLLHLTATFSLASVGAVLQARNEMARYGATLFFDKAFMLVLLAIASPVTPLAVLVLYALSSSTVVVIALFLIGPAALWPMTFSRAGYRQMMAFSLPLVLSSWAGLLGTNWFDFIVIKQYRPVSEVGLYSLGTVLAGVAQQVTIIFSTLLLPQLSVMVARGELDRIRTLAERVLPYYFLATSVLFSGVILGAPWIVPFVFGPSFEGSVVVLAILMLAACSLAFFNAFSPLVSALGSTWILSGICLASGGVNVVMDLLLVPSYGIQGAAFATVAAYGVSAVLVLAFVQTRLSGRVLELAWLASPVALLSTGFLLIQGPAFYLYAVPVAVVSIYALARRFRLFRGDDAAFIRGLALARPR